jgi:hypothetical protein
MRNSPEGGRFAALIERGEAVPSRKQFTRSSALRADFAEAFMGRMPMRFVVAALLLLVVPVGVQARIQPQSAPPETGRLPGIAERGPPGSVRLPGMVEFRASSSDPFVAHELREAREDIERRRDSGELSRREARALRREARRVERLSYRYGRDGLDTAERRELELRATVLSAQASAPRPR